MQTEKQKRLRIKAIHPSDAYSDIAGCIIGQEIESFEESTTEYRKSDRRKKGFVSGAVIFKEPIAMINKKDKKFYFYAIQLEEF